MEELIFARLKELNIPYQLKHHEPIYTVADAQQYRTDFPGLKVKNLLLKDKKTGKLYLAVLGDVKRLDMKALSKLMTGKPTFASDEELLETMGLLPGAVTPLALVHEKAGAITVVLDYDLVSGEQEASVNFHPGVNTATIAISLHDFHRYLTGCGNKVIKETSENQYFLI